MKKKSRILAHALFLAIFLTACNGQVTVEPSATLHLPQRIRLFPLQLLLHSQPPTPTITPTLPPTEPPIPQPASLTGIIFLSGDTSQPFISS